MHTTQDQKTRLRTIVLCKIAFEALEAYESSDSRSKQADFANSTTNATKSNHEVTSDRNTESLFQNQIADASNASNATLQASLGEVQEPDPSLEKTSEYLKNLQEAEQARIQKCKNKSKRAEMAETQSSRNV